MAQSAKKFWNVWVGDKFHNVAARNANDAKARAEELAGLAPAEAAPVEHLGPRMVGD